MKLTITDPDDPRLADYVRLRETSLRRHLESEHGLFIAEGEKVIRRAVEAGYRPRSFLLAERWLDGLSDILRRWPAVPVFVVTEDLAEQVTGFHVHRGALASLHREQRHGLDELLALRRVVVLEDIVDHTNVGAILRNAAGLGWDGALLSPRTADPLYRRSIKVSMGAVFSLPWARLEDWRGAPELLGAAGFRTVALTLTPEALELSQVAAEINSETRVGGHVGHRGCRPLEALVGWRRHTSAHSDVRRHRLTQCRRRRGYRLLRTVGPRRDGPIVGIEVSCILVQ